MSERSDRGMIARVISRRQIWRIVGALLVSLYCLFFRVHDLDKSFWLLSEQVRDWSAVQGPFGDLPLTGPRSPNSGLSIGPAYYWFLWGSRVVLDPVIGPFPHTGGWAISLLNSVGDFFLLIALGRRLESWFLAAAAVLLGATSPYDAGLTATIWNPPVAVAYVKLATAALLWRERPTTVTSALSLGFAWLALQLHPSAVVVTAPVTIWVAYTVGSSAKPRRIVLCGAVLALSVALAFVPFVVDPFQGGEGGVASSLSRAVSDPLAFLRPAESAAATMWAVDLILAAPFTYGWFGWLVVAGAVAVVLRWRVSSLPVVSASIVLTTILVFSFWQGRFDQYYWFLVVAPAAAICVVTPLSWLQPTLRVAVGLVAVLLVLGLQPSRMELAWGPAFRQPAYGTLLTGAQAIARTGRPVRSVSPQFEVPVGMNPLFLVSLAGGRVDLNAREIGVIRRDGSVVIEVP